jgi:hypothetical protein
MDPFKVIVIATVIVAGSVIGGSVPLPETAQLSEMLQKAAAAVHRLELLKPPYPASLRGAVVTAYDQRVTTSLRNRVLAVTGY